MKTQMRIMVIAALILWGWQARAQQVIGTWQLTDEKTCFQSEMKESQTEKELVPQMGGSSSSSVARLLILDKKGKGKEGVFTTGSKKGDRMNEFKYQVSGQSLQILDSKSGIMTRELVIDELSETTLRVHDAKKDCEIKIFTRTK